MKKAKHRKPYRKHRPEYVPAWPSQYLEGQPSGMPRYPGYERCLDCCVTITDENRNGWCSLPRDERFASYPIKKKQYDR